jgi:hypothetical protein
MEYEEKLEDFLTTKAHGLVAAQAGTQKHYKAELRKMLEETNYFAECFNELLKFKLIIGQPNLEDDDDRERGSPA